MDPDQPIIPLVDATQDLHVWFRAPLEPHQARLMEALGVVVHVDPPVTTAA